MDRAAMAFKIVAAAVTAAVVVGCGGLSEKDVIGKWERRVEISLDDEGAGPAQFAAERMARAMTIELYLRDDGTCMAVENEVSSDGTWELEGRQVTLTFEQGGRLRFGDGKPMKLTVSEDAKSMESTTSLTDPAVGYVFKKSS